MRARKYICILPVYLLPARLGVAVSKVRAKSELCQSYIRVTLEPLPFATGANYTPVRLTPGGHYCLIQNHKVIIWLYGCGQQMGCYAFSKYKFARQTATS